MEGGHIMALSPFHALYKARKLSSYAFGRDRLVPVFASSDIEAYPYQIAAALFALRSPYLKGAILCDEGSLGKTYEAMLVITQMWYEGKQKILIVVPTPLLYQWMKIIEDKFSVPLYTIDSNETFDSCVSEGQQNPFLQDGIVLTTYDFAAEKAEQILQVKWDMTVFEEAHHLRRIYTDENKGAAAIRQAARDSFKLLLTATPMQNSILDIYGLIQFIDDSVFPDEKMFYQRYFRKPENYGELASRVSKYCFRTTRPQVANYVKIPERIPITVEYELTKPEQRLYDLLNEYLQRPEKIAFPKMEQYDLTLMLFRTLSSSTFAVEKTLRGVVTRLEALSQAEAENSKVSEELSQIRQMHTLAKSIRKNAKGTQLLEALKTGFARLKSLGANKKALIFTENRTTQKYLYSLLNANGYQGKVLTYSGDKSRDYSIMERFRKDVQILITTDVAAEGFNLEFCSFVINYDLPYNTLTIEQRVTRCHRQGQQSDVMVLNFLNRNNFADVRMLELINKRVLQFSGVFGMSDDVLGNFGLDLGKAFALARTKEEIDHAYTQVLTEFEEENKRLVAQSEESLFTSFSKEVADKVTITPQYIKDRSKEINDDLWAITKYFFENRTDFYIDEETRTISCFGSPPKVFTGAAMRRNEYSMAKDYQPRSGRHTITGALARNILHEIFWVGIPDRGTVYVEDVPSPCTIGYYQVKVKPKGVHWGGTYYYTFVGKTADGHVLADEECRKLMELPVLRFTKDGETYGERDGLSKTKHAEELDNLVDTEEFIQQTSIEMDGAQKEEIARLQSHTLDLKAGLERELDGLRIQLQQTEKALEKPATRIEKIRLQKEVSALRKELKTREQNLFFDGLRLEQELEEQVKHLLGDAVLTATFKREFIIRIQPN